MKLESVVIKIGVGIVFSMAFTFSNAALECKDVKYGHNDYHDNMAALAIEARLIDGSDGYFNRYHEAVVSELCGYSEDDGYIESMIDTGYVRRSEVEGIKEALSLDNRSRAGTSYEYSRAKFSALGLSSVASGHVAEFYTKEPESQCGQLAKYALEGNPRAISELQNEPNYCTWEYSE